jgi:hypothetical protein
MFSRRQLALNHPRPCEVALRGIALIKPGLWRKLAAQDTGCTLLFFERDDLNLERSDCTLGAGRMGLESLGDGNGLFELSGQCVEARSEHRILIVQGRVVVLGGFVVIAIQKSMSPRLGRLGRSKSSHPSHWDSLLRLPGQTCTIALN